MRRSPTAPSQDFRAHSHRSADAAYYLAALTRFFRETVSERVNIEVVTNNWFRVMTPHAFHDGDPFVLELRRGSDGWKLCDGCAMRRRSDACGVGLAARPEISAAMHQYQVYMARCGFCMRLDARPLGSQLSCFLQFMSLAARSDPVTLTLSYSDFVQRFRSLLRRYVPAECLSFDWTDRQQDPRRLHRVDCRIECHPPWMAFAVQSSSGCRRVRRTCEFWQAKGLDFRSLVFFQNLRRIVVGDVARVSDVVDKLFSSLDSEERVAGFLQSRLSCCAACDKPSCAGHSKEPRG